MEFWTHFDVAGAAFGIGLGVGLLLGIVQLHTYRGVLVRIAKAGTSERLPDGRFYKIVPEDGE